jgi:hypothetical protein
VCRKLWATAYKHSIHINEYLASARLVTPVT